MGGSLREYDLFSSFKISTMKWRKKIIENISFNKKKSNKPKVIVDGSKRLLWFWLFSSNNFLAWVDSSLRITEKIRK